MSKCDGCGASVSTCPKHAREVGAQHGSMLLGYCLCPGCSSRARDAAISAAASTFTKDDSK